MVERPSTEDIHKAFRLFDQGQKGKVDLDDLKRIASQASHARPRLGGCSVAQLCTAPAVAWSPSTHFARPLPPRRLASRSRRMR